MRYETVKTKKALDQKTRDYRAAGYNIVTYGEKVRELESKNDFVMIEIKKGGANNDN